MKERLAVRALLINAKKQVLLLKNLPGFFKHPLSARFPERPFWITPGGGIEQGETHRQALVRELHEETGILEDEILSIHEPAIWYREVILEKNNIPCLFKETFYLVRVGSVKVQLENNPDAFEKEYLSSLRWWSLEELLASDEIFFPQGIKTLVPPLFFSLPKETKTIV